MSNFGLHFRPILFSILLFFLFFFIEIEKIKINIFFKYNYLLYI